MKKLRCPEVQSVLLQADNCVLVRRRVISFWRVFNKLQFRWKRSQDSRMAVTETQGTVLQTATFVRRIKQCREGIRPIVSEMRHTYVRTDRLQR
jgi:hypothetical protein